jgi:hypothetical protein
MRENSLISVISVVVDSLILYRAAMKGSRLSRRLRIVRFSFNREISGVDIFIKNTFNDVDIFNYGDRKCRMCETDSAQKKAESFLILI